MAAVNMLLSTRGLTRRFGGLTAVDNVDFDLPEGEIRALIGPNGAGKTTLVGLISGRVPPSAGSVAFAGRDITAMPAHLRVREGIAYTFQITSIFANLTVGENVALAAQRPGGKPVSASEILGRVGLAGLEHELARNLPYGHQRLLEVAMGLALRPRLLILDEPTQGLSDGEIARFVALVREIATEATVLLIEHNMDVVMQLAERITVMDRGRVIAEGTPSEIRANRDVQAAYLGVPADG